MSDILKIEPIDNWLKKNNWSFYNHQIETLKLSENGFDVLLVAPTGGGKTLAGFLPSLKDLINISELRNIKPKKYNWWRIDTFFKKNKFINIKIIENGGWHFTEIKTPKEIFIKHTNDEHHDEFDQTGIREENIKDMIKNRYIPYDHSVDQKEFEWHRDHCERKVYVIYADLFWKFQFDDQIPFLLKTGSCFKIKSNDFHRLIKGRGSLILMIEEK